MQRRNLVSETCGLGVFSTGESSAGFLRLIFVHVL